jgi:pimeloyl-[acyl-carrier protein] methyl ester esterase
VSSLVLLAGNPSFPSSGLGTQAWPGMDVSLLDDFADHLNKNCQATLLRFLSLQVSSLPDHKLLLKKLKTAVLECAAPDKNTLQGGLEILKKADLRPVLSGLTVPVSVILGGLDTLVPVAAGQKMQQLLPSLELNIIDRAGHVPFLSHSRETVAIISRFMDEQCS